MLCIQLLHGNSRIFLIHLAYTLLFDFLMRSRFLGGLGWLVRWGGGGRMG